ncbi:MAG: PaaI family thioesterase [Flavobacteriales bacterium]
MDARAIVDQMMKNDAFSQWLGIEIIQILPGKAELSLIVKPEMLNGFGILHGGISYSLADSALAFAANSKGMQAVSTETSISHLKPAKVGDTLLATAREIHCSKSTGIYQIEIKNQNNDFNNDLIAHFKGTVFRTKTAWGE